MLYDIPLYGVYRRYARQESGLVCTEACAGSFSCGFPGWKGLYSTVPGGRVENRRADAV